MQVQDFLERIDTIDIPPVLLFCPGTQPGSRKPELTFEPLLAHRAVERLIARLVDPSLRDMALTIYYGDEVSESTIIQEAQTFPFLAERRVVLVRQAEKLAAINPRSKPDDQKSARGKNKPKEPLEAYLDSPADTAVLILVTAMIDRRLKLYKTFESLGGVVECPVLRERDVESWLSAELQTSGKRIDAPAAKALVDRTGTGLSEVMNALNLVVNYVGTAPVITQEDVMAACADVAEEQVWTLTDAIAASDMGKALHALRELLDLGKHPDELMGTINWLIKSAYCVASPVSPKPNPYVAQKVRPLAEKLGLPKLRDAFALCTDTQFLMRNTGVDSSLAIELLVIKLAAPRKRRPVAAR